jgi:hypothetical protein
MSIANANSDSKFLQIYKFVAELPDKDTAIRATDQKLSAAELKKDKNINFDNGKGATHLYVRSGFFSKLRQVLTSGTDGAINKQKMAKDLIIDALKSLPAELQDKSYVKNAFDSIKETLNSHDGKDITARMIKGDLTTIYNALEESNKATKTNNLCVTQSDLNAPVENNARVSVVDVSPTVKKSVLPDGAEESIDSKAKKERIQASDSDLLSMVKLNALPDPISLSGLANMQKLNALPNLEPIKSQEKNTDTQQADSPPLNLVASIDVAEVVLNSLDPLVNGKPAEETNSSLDDDEIPDGDDALSEVESGSDSDDEDGAVSSYESTMPADSGTVINETPAENEKSIEQGVNLADGRTVNNQSSTPSVASSKEETKLTAKDNPYLKSLKTEWKAKNGVYEVSKPFHISYDVPASHMIAQAYLLPVGRQLKLPGNTKNSSGEGSFVIKNAEAPKLTRVGGNKLIVNQRTAKRLEKIRDELFNVYLDTFAEIRNNYKKLNSGEDLETLVIVPISALPETLADVESQALASALHAIQSENPNLKIAISADKDRHAARIQSDYENIVSKSV